MRDIIKVMRIEGPRSTDGVRKSDKARKASGSSADFKSFLDGGTDETQAAVAAPVVGDVGALIAAQSFEDPAEKKAKGRMIARAGQVLDALDRVHHGLLAGQLTLGDAENVSRAVAAQREKIADPALNGLLDEVDLRAQVELAKMEMARDKSKS